jgi:hypothetical protein
MISDDLSICKPNCRQASVYTKRRQDLINPTQNRVTEEKSGITTYMSTPSITKVAY